MNLRLIVIFLFIGVFSYGQRTITEKIRNIDNIDKKKWSYGYYLGLNSFDYKFDYNEVVDEIQTEKSLGFNVGLVGDMRINDYFNLRLEPGINFVTRNLTFPDPRLSTFLNPTFFKILLKRSP